MEKCNQCCNQEKYHGKLICQHIQSMKGLEAEQEYVDCDSVTKCDYFEKSKNNITCSECTDDCYNLTMSCKCPKLENKSIVDIREQYREEYEEFIATERGIEWQNFWKRETGSERHGDYGDYLYDFHPEVLQ